MILTKKPSQQQQRQQQQQMPKSNQQQVIFALIVAFSFYIGSSMGQRKRRHRQDFLEELGKLSSITGGESGESAWGGGKPRVWMGWKGY